MSTTRNMRNTTGGGSFLRRFIASPHDTLTVGCTHLKRTTEDTDKASCVRNHNNMSMITKKCLAKFLERMHVRLSKGHENHLSIMLGDWNTTKKAMKEDVDACLHEHAASTQGETITAQYQERRDHGAFFHGHRQWKAEGENHSLFSEVINAFKSSKEEAKRIETKKAEH